MNDKTLLVVVIAAVLLGVIMYLKKQKDDRLRAEGKIIHRENGFMEKAEYFTLTLDDKARVAEGLQRIAYSEMHVTMSGDSAQQVFQFSNTYGWDARLSYKGMQDGKAVYYFLFTSWQQREGVLIEGALYMNMLATAIEKMFLDIDPETKVQTEWVERKTK